MSYSQNTASAKINTKELAAEIAKLLGSNLSSLSTIGDGSNSRAHSYEPDFKSDAALADAMVKRSSSIEGSTNLGNKRDSNTVNVSSSQNVNSILDLLKGIEK